MDTNDTGREDTNRQDNPALTGDIPEAIAEGDERDGDRQGNNDLAASSIMAGNAVSGTANVGGLGAAVLGQAAAKAIVDEEDPDVRTDPDSPD